MLLIKIASEDILSLCCFGAAYSADCMVPCAVMHGAMSSVLKLSSAQACAQQSVYSNHTPLPILTKFSAVAALVQHTMQTAWCPAQQC